MRSRPCAAAYPRPVAVALVDQLEAIQVQDQQRRRPARAPGVRNRLQGAIAEQVAVRQAGQGS